MSNATSCSCGDRLFYPAKVRANVDGFERIVTFMAGYICPVIGPRSHGRHGLDALFLLRNQQGAVQFSLMTGWTPDCLESHDNRIFRPFPADLGYHSPKPQYEGQSLMDANCRWLEGPCYYDGSSLNADGVFNILVQQGEEAMWRRLEEYHNSLFAT